MGPFYAEQLREIEIKKWDFPADLSNLVVNSFESLKWALPFDPRFGKIYLHATIRGTHGNYDLYARMGLLRRGDFSYVAYGCHSCKKVIVGHPQMDVSSGEKLWEQDLVVSCKNCSACLDRENQF
ncbi:hypothetical protein HY501_03035 [Candidatus Woesearchaeota archaeon]|nr:hypothetical protein [Candidatus Woesearchaeota archaeon]